MLAALWTLLGLVALASLATVLLVLHRAGGARNFASTVKARAANDSGAVSLSALLTALIVVVVGLALIPTVQNSVNNSLNAVGATSSAGTLIDLIPLLFVLVIFAGIIVFIAFKE